MLVYIYIYIAMYMHNDLSNIYLYMSLFIAILQQCMQRDQNVQIEFVASVV